MATKETVETDEQRKARYQAVEHSESIAAINAAEAVLLPLGFTRRKADKVYFEMDAPGRVDAEWNLKDPEITAHITRQTKGWNSTVRGDGSFFYRLVLSARQVWRIRDPRISPGNRPGVLAYIEKVKETLAEDVTYNKNMERLVRDAKSFIAHSLSNLKITSIEAEDDNLVLIRVKGRAGGQFCLALNGSLNFLSLKVVEDESRSVTIDPALRRALGAL